jgi:hypothetical protein
MDPPRDFRQARRRPFAATVASIAIRVRDAMESQPWKMPQSDRRKH